MLTRYTVAPEGAEEFTALAAKALEALGRRPGYRKGTLGRAADDPALWTVVTEWEGPGYYRRALSDFDVRMAAMPLLSLAYDEPSAYEVLVEVP